METKQNYNELVDRFKVEELKERLEFTTAEAAGWDKKTDVTVTGTNTTSQNTQTGANTNTQSVSVGVKTSVGW